MEFRIVDNIKYKLCCGNCQYYLGASEENKINHSNCGCTERLIKYHNRNRWMKRYNPSDIPCKYFSFVAKIPYSDTAKDPFMEAARLLKNHCELTECDQCCFFVEKETRCRLESKREYNFGRVASEWDV